MSSNHPSKRRQQHLHTNKRESAAAAKPNMHYVSQRRDVQNGAAGQQATSNGSALDKNILAPWTVSTPVSMPNGIQNTFATLPAQQTGQRTMAENIAQWQLPVIPFGAGTSGAVSPLPNNRAIMNMPHGTSFAVSEKSVQPGQITIETTVTNADDITFKISHAPLEEANVPGLDAQPIVGSSVVAEAINYGADAANVSVEANDALKHTVHAASKHAVQNASDDPFTVTINDTIRGSLNDALTGALNGVSTAAVNEAAVSTLDLAPANIVTERFKLRLDDYLIPIAEAQSVSFESTLTDADYTMATPEYLYFELPVVDEPVEPIVQADYFNSPKKCPKRVHGNTHDDHLCRAKYKQLTKYIKPLKRITQKMRNEGKNVANITKMTNLLQILCNITDRVPLETLRKYEKALERVEPSLFSDHHFKKALMPLMQSIKQTFLLSNGGTILKRTFRTAVDTIFESEMRYLIPHKMPREAFKDPFEMPQTLKYEIARLNERFTVSLDATSARNISRLRLICELHDKHIPSVPQLSVEIPEYYPFAALIYTVNVEDYLRTSYLRTLYVDFCSRLAKLSPLHTFTNVMNSWEEAVFHACVYRINDLNDADILDI